LLSRNGGSARQCVGTAEARNGEGLGSHRSSRTSKENPEVNAAVDLLAELFPKTFSRFEQRRRPLKVGIRTDILATLDGVIMPNELAHALSCYCANVHYLDACRPGAARIGLDGEPAGIVTVEEAAHAFDKYTGLLARRARRRASSTAQPKPKSKGDGLAELRAAALRRKAGAP